MKNVLSSKPIILRLKEALNIRTDTELGKALGVGKAAVSNWKGQSTIPSDQVMYAASEYNLSLDWLISGQGEMRRSDARLERSASGLEIRHVGSIAAGGGHGPADGFFSGAEDTGEMIDAPAFLTKDEIAKHGGLIAATVRGTSMEPAFMDQDTVYMYAQDPQMNDIPLLIGKACAITLTELHSDSDVCLKKLRWPDNQKQGHFNLESINQEWPTLVNIPIKSALPVRYVKRNI